jgi:predicted Zn-dependent protease
VDPHSTGGEELSLTEEDRVLWEAADYIETKLAKDRDSFDGERAMEQYLQEIVERLAPEFFTDDSPELRSHVLISASVNAFVLPNGAIYVTSGMLVLLENEAQLATVLGHEFSHFQYRHHLRQELQDENARRAGALFGVFLAGLAGAATGTVDTNLSSSAADLWTRVSGAGYTRDLEREADKMGLIAVLKASYDPNQTVRAFQLIRDASLEDSEEDQGLFASHPKLTERIENYRQYLQTPEMRSLSSGRVVGAEQYVNHVLPVMLAHAELEIRLHHTEDARKTLERYLKAATRDAKATFLMAEAFRHESKRKGDKNLILARQHYRMAIELDPGCIDCYRELGLIYRAMGEQELSREFLSKYVELGSERPDVPIIKSLFIQTD